MSNRVTNKVTIKNDEYANMRVGRGINHINFTVIKNMEKFVHNTRPIDETFVTVYDDDLVTLYNVIKEHLTENGRLPENTDTMWEAVHANVGKNMYVRLTSGVDLYGMINYANSAHMSIIDTKQGKWLLPWQIVSYVRIGGE